MLISSFSCSKSFYRFQIEIAKTKQNKKKRTAATTTTTITTTTNKFCVRVHMNKYTVTTIYKLAHHTHSNGFFVLCLVPS